MAVLGTGGSGKSAFLKPHRGEHPLDPWRTLPVYALDFASRLDMVTDLPNVGAVVPGSDQERTVRLLRMLRGLIDERLTRFASVRANTIGEYREIAERPDKARSCCWSMGTPPSVRSTRSASSPRSTSSSSRSRSMAVTPGARRDRCGSARGHSLGARSSCRSTRASHGQRQRVLLGRSSAGAFPLGTPPGRGYFDSHEVQVAVLGERPTRRCSGHHRRARHAGSTAWNRKRLPSDRSGPDPSR